MRNARIRPPDPVVVPIPVVKPSPLAAFVDALHGIAANRDMFTAFAAYDMSPGAGWSQFLEDVNMMLTERLVVGIRSPFLRRVALPVFMAHRMLDEQFQQPDEKARAHKAIEILQQCQDAHVRHKCIDWIREVYNV